MADYGFVELLIAERTNTIIIVHLATLFSLFQTLLVSHSFNICVSSLFKSAATNRKCSNLLAKQQLFEKYRINKSAMEKLIMLQEWFETFLCMFC